MKAKTCAIGIKHRETGIEIDSIIVGRRAAMRMAKRGVEYQRYLLVRMAYLLDARGLDRMAYMVRIPGTRTGLYFID